MSGHSFWVLGLQPQVYEQVEIRAGFEEEAEAVRERGVTAVELGKNSSPNAWWDSGSSLLEPSTAKGEQGLFSG